MEWIIRMCRQSAEFREALQHLMGVGHAGTAEETAQAFAEWVAARAPQPKQRRGAA